MSCCQSITNQGSVNSDQIFYRVSSLRIRNVTLNSPLNASYTLTLPLDAGSANQVLTTDGVGNLFWISGSAIPGAGTVTSVSATVPSFLTVNVTNPTTLPQIQIGGSSTGTGSVVLSNAPTFTGTVTLGAQTNGTAAAFANMLLSNPLPTGSGGTGLNSVGSANQILLSNGTNYVLTSSTGTGTNVLSNAPTFTGTVTLGAQTNGTAAAFVNMLLSNPLPTGSGGTGLSTIGTNGQVLTSSGTALSWQTLTASSNIGVATGISLDLTSNLTLASGGRIRLNDAGNNRKVVLFGDANNFQYSGFGTTGGTLLYNCFTSSDDHVFNSGASTTTFLELLRLRGNGLVNIPGLTASRTVATDGSRNLISVANTGTGNYVLQNTPTLVTPILGNATYTTLDAGTLLGKRRIVTYSATANAEQFNGIGTIPDGQTYQVDATAASHIFYAATNSTTSNELFRVKGTGGFTSLGNSEISGTLTVSGQFYNSNITNYTMSANSTWNNNSNESPSNWQVAQTTGFALTNTSGGTFQNNTGVIGWVTVTWSTRRTVNAFGLSRIFINVSGTEFGSVVVGGIDWMTTTATFRLGPGFSFTLIGFQDSGSNVQFQAINSQLAIRIDY